MTKKGVHSINTIPHYGLDNAYHYVFTLNVIRFIKVLCMNERLTWASLHVLNMTNKMKAV